RRTPLVPRVDLRQQGDPHDLSLPEKQDRFRPIRSDGIRVSTIPVSAEPEGGGPSIPRPEDPGGPGNRIDAGPPEVDERLANLALCAGPHEDGPIRRFPAPVFLHADE